MTERATSKMSIRNQTTIPAAVRVALGIKCGQRLGYVIDGEQVRLVNASAAEEDPVTESVLEILAHDIESHPENLTPISQDLLDRMRRLTRGGGPIDHDEPIDGETIL